MTRGRLLSALEAAAVLALAASAIAQIHTSPAADWEGGRAVHDVLALGFCLPLLARRRHPVPAFAVILGATWVQYELGGGLGQPFFAVLIGLYSVGAHASRPGSWLGPASVLAVIVAIDVPRLLDGAPWDEVVPAWFFLLGVWGLGWWVRHRRIETEGFALQAAEAERESASKARAAVADERARIARELHDLVSHNIGVVVLQAQGAQRAFDQDPARARAALRSIEHAGRQGLGEMRRMLALLTDPDQAAPEGPQPSLGRVEELVEQVRAAGTSVELEVCGDAHELGPGVELAAYRVVQEALTNALKHAPGAPVRVRVEYGADDVRVSVEDDGAPAPRVRPESGGRGLVGLGERVSLYGGELHTGPRPSGGFAVTARLPVRSAT